MDVITRLALAIHEADLGGPCKARGSVRNAHAAAYVAIAARFVDRLASRWEPAHPPDDVLHRGRRVAPSAVGGTD